MLKRTLLIVHRWLGVALCLVFLLWFPSGIGMMYWEFPGVSADDRLERAPSLNVSTVRLSPSEAYATLQMPQPPTSARLNTFDGRPIYRFRTDDIDSLVYADTGMEQVLVSREMMDRIASRWTGQPIDTAAVRMLDEVDQWTVQANFKRLAPLWKYTWPNGEQVYLSEMTGEVVQYTTAASRLGAYLGPIPHWLYFTPLRRHGPVWSQTVIWLSAVGTFTAILGIVIGVWMYSPSKRYRIAGRETSIPYRGQKRWHTILGLVFGVATVTWAFSGLLSMDPFPLGTNGAGGGRRGNARSIQQALGGRPELDRFSPKHPRTAIAEIADLPVKELELKTVGDRPLYLATISRRDTRIVPVDGSPLVSFDRQEIVDIVTKAAPATGLADVSLLSQYDRYYLDRTRERPLPVILARTNDGTRYYIDPKTARVAGTYSPGNWATRWLYHGLHSLDFPWLYNYRPLWDIVVITFMLGGTALAVTSFVLAWRAVGRKMAGALDADATLGA
jgi:hypothetical protein